MLTDRLRSLTHGQAHPASGRGAAPQDVLRRLSSATCRAVPLMYGTIPDSKPWHSPKVRMLNQPHSPNVQTQKQARLSPKVRVSDALMDQRSSPNALIPPMYGSKRLIGQQNSVNGCAAQATPSSAKAVSALAAHDSPNVRNFGLWRTHAIPLKYAAGGSIPPMYKTISYSCAQPLHMLFSVRTLGRNPRTLGDKTRTLGRICQYIGGNDFCKPMI